MLINDFYKIIDTDYSIENSGSFKVTIELNDEHKIFNGHFPGNPVVPGVCLIQMVKETLEEILNKELFLSESANIKFISVVQPQINKVLNLGYSVKQENDIFQVNVLISFEEKIFVKFKGVFRDK